MSPKSTKSLSTSSMDSFGMRCSQKRLLHSDSSVSYQPGNAVTRTAPSHHHFEGLRQALAGSTSYDDLDTTTSRSVLHGFMLVTIMVTSLVAFICSKVRRCSSYIDINTYEDCSKYFLFYSTMTITSCLVTFMIYFLHLIAQCNILCLVRKKYEFEIMLIAVVSSLLLLSSICYLTHTNVMAESFTLASFVFSSLATVLYFVRVAILTYEMVSQQKRIQKAQMQKTSVRSIQSNRSITNPVRSSSRENSLILSLDQYALPTNKVISYVRNSQRTKTLSTSLSEELDDDVFIQ